MRKIINSTYITLDGLIDNPHHWPDVGARGELGEKLQTDLLMACDAMLMGRRTYEGFAPVWPTRSGDPYSDRINTMPKYVVSTTLKDPEWTNTTVIGKDVVGRLRQLKEEPGQDIVQYGFGQLSHTMLEHGLLDELRLWFYPLIVGRGGPQELLYRDSTMTKFDLVDTTPLENGIVVLSYVRA